MIHVTLSEANKRTYSASCSELPIDVECLVVQEGHKHEPLHYIYLVPIRGQGGDSHGKRLRQNRDHVLNKLSRVIYDSQYGDTEQFYFYDPIKLHITLPACRRPTTKTKRGRKVARRGV